MLLLDHVGGSFEVTGLPRLVGEGLREDPVAARYLAVTVRNSGYRAFGYEAVLDVTDAGRDALARGGVEVGDAWEPETLRETGQEAYGRAVGVPPLDPGDQGVVYFPVRSSGALADGVDVEFVLTAAGGRERRVARMAGSTPVRRPPAPASGLVVSGDVVGVHASTRPPAGRAGTSTRRATQAGEAAPEARTGG